MEWHEAQSSQNYTEREKQYWHYPTAILWSFSNQDHVVLQKTNISMEQS